jgi:hypothetical protein
MIPLLRTATRRSLRRPRRRVHLKDMSTKSDVVKKKDEGWSLTTKLGVAFASVVVPTVLGVTQLRSDPELRDEVRLKFPELYGLLHSIVPGGVEDVTMAQLLAKKNDWPYEHELPWGEGYDEDIPPRTAIVTTKRGSKFTVELVATDCNKGIINKAIPFGASFDDEVLDVQFVNNGEHQSHLSSAMAEQRKARTSATDAMSKAELQEQLHQVRQAEHKMKVDKKVWENMGQSGVGKVTELARELQNFEKEKIQLKALIKKR